MRKLLLATAVLTVLTSPAVADNISMDVFVDGVFTTNLSSATGNLVVGAQSFGVFNLNSLTINSQDFLAAGGILDTNTVNANTVAGGNHTLFLDITANNLAGPGALSGILSEFSVTGMTNGWSAFGQTLINGNSQVISPTVTANSALGSAVTFDVLSNPFSAEVRYTIMSVGTGQFNGGIDLTIAAVPGPIVGAGIPGIVAALGMLGLAGWRRRKQLS